MQWSEVQNLKPPPPGRRIPYGPHPDNFGDLRLPAQPGPHPLVVLIHGGCWRDSINLDHLAHLAHTLTLTGLATWNVEYRRADTSGGGYPGTFDDILAAFGHIAHLPGVDTHRLAVAGHSAGGQLALWLAAQRHYEIRGVVSLSGIPDLRAAAPSVCGGMIPQLAGSKDNYQKISPIDLLPLHVPQWIITAEFDDIVPPFWGQQYAAAATMQKDKVKLINIPNANHFDLIVPTSPAHMIVRNAIQNAIES